MILGDALKSAFYYSVKFFYYDLFKTHKMSTEKIKQMSCSYYQIQLNLPFNHINLKKCYIFSRRSCMLFQKLISVLISPQVVTVLKSCILSVHDFALFNHVKHIMLYLHVFILYGNNNPIVNVIPYLLNDHTYLLCLKLCL